MKRVLLLTAALAQIPPEAQAYSVFIPPGNIVQNGSFQSVSTNWSGTASGYLLVWPSVPNDHCALAQDLYQDLPTVRGESYSLSFYAAADLFFGPSVTIAVDLNQRPLVSYATPAYAYNPLANRYDQMHWQEFTSSFVADANTTRLEFIDLNTYDFGLAAISVIAIPERTSTALFIAGAAGLIAIGRKRFWTRHIPTNHLA